jgi:hypothetical protein
MLIITPQSHLDHHLTMGHLRFILATLGDRSGFFAETVKFPRVDLAALPCALRGPAVGLDPVPDTHVELRARPGRAYPSRLLLPWRDRPAQPEYPRDVLVDRLTVIAGPDGDLPCVLYTAFGGPLAPKEPGDPTLLEAEREASVAFWAVHALVP